MNVIRPLRGHVPVGAGTGLDAGLPPLCRLRMVRNSRRLPAMAAGVTLDPILVRFREAVAALDGPALDRIVLFGSRARVEAGAHADYDVAVCLKDVDPGMTAWYRLADLRTRLLEIGGPFFEAISFWSSDHDRPSPIMSAIRRDGVTL